MLKSSVHRFGQWYIRQVLRSEAETQKSRPINERPVELAFVFECVRDLQPSRVLDVGSGQSPLPALLRNCGCHVTAIDNVTDYWGYGLLNRHWYITNENICKPTVLSTDFDLVTCVSVIEHIDDPASAFRSMIDLLAPNAHLILTMPYNETRYVEDVYKLPGGDLGEQQLYRCSSYNRPMLDQWLSSASAQIVRQDYWAFWTGEVWRQGERVAPPQRSTATQPHQITCILIRRDK
jgi:SAM-dependent methyltransferase